MALVIVPDGVYCRYKKTALAQCRILFFKVYGMEHVAIIVFWMFFTLVVPIYVYRDATNNKIAYPERWGVGVALSLCILLPLYLVIRLYFRGTDDELNGWHAGYRDANPVLVYAVIILSSLSGLVSNF